MKLKLLAADQGVPIAAPYGQASPGAFAGGAEATAQGLGQLERAGVRALATIQAAEDEFKLQRIKSEALNRETSFELDVERFDGDLRATKADPETYTAEYNRRFQERAAQALQGTLYPETAELLRQRIERIRLKREDKVLGHRNALFKDSEGARMESTIATQKALARLVPLGDHAGWIERLARADFATTMAAPVIGLKEAALRKERVTDEFVRDRAGVHMRDAPEDFLTHGRRLYEPLIGASALAALEEGALKRLEAVETKAHTAFVRNSDRVRIAIEAKAREGADILGDVLNARETLTGSDFSHLMTVNDALVRARGVETSDQAVLTDVRAGVLNREIRTPGDLYARANGRIKHEDLRTELNKIAEMNESERRETKTDAEKALDRAVTAGKAYIAKSAETTAQLVQFDSIAKAVEAEQLHAFEVRTRGLQDPGKIDEIAREMVITTRQILADRLRLDGVKLNPLLGKYKTEQEVAAAVKARDIDQATGDVTIHQMRYIQSLTQQQEAKATQRGVEAVAPKVQEATSPPRPTIAGTLKDIIFGEKPISSITEPFTRPKLPPMPAADAAQYTPLFREAVQSLFPKEPIGKVVNDDAKMEKVAREMARLLTERGGRLDKPVDVTTPETPPAKPERPPAETTRGEKPPAKPGAAPAVPKGEGPLAEPIKILRDTIEAPKPNLEAITQPQARELVRESAHELYPEQSLGDVQRDEEKIRAVLRRAVKKAEERASQPSKPETPARPSERGETPPGKPGAMSAPRAVRDILRAPTAPATDTTKPGESPKPAAPAKPAKAPDKKPEPRSETKPGKPMVATASPPGLESKWQGVIDWLTGKRPATKADAKDPETRDLVQEAARTLYPSLRMIEIMRDPKKVNAVMDLATANAVEKLRTERFKKTGR